MSKSAIIIEQDLGVYWQDAGPWRFFELTTHGCCRDSLMANATISEVDQDGGVINCYGLGHARPEVERRVLAMIEVALSRQSDAIPCGDPVRNIGTPKTLEEAIRNGLAISPAAVVSHVQDFLAQKFAVEMLEAENSEETLKALGRLWDQIRSRG